MLYWVSLGGQCGEKQKTGKVWPVDTRNRWQGEKREGKCYREKDIMRENKMQGE